MAIGIETIAVNRYAPQGADAISLYSNGSAEGLTLAQLAISVCLQAASAYEGQSVVKMNILTRGAVKLDGAAQWMEKIANGSADWTQAKAYITSELWTAPHSGWRRSRTDRPTGPRRRRT